MTLGEMQVFNNVLENDTREKKWNTEMFRRAEVMKATY